MAQLLRELASSSGSPVDICGIHFTTQDAVAWNVVATRYFHILNLQQRVSVSGDRIFVEGHDPSGTNVLASLEGLLKLEVILAVASFVEHSSRGRRNCRRGGLTRRCARLNHHHSLGLAETTELSPC